MNLALITHKVVRGEGQARVNYEIAQRAARAGWHVTLIAGKVAPELQNCLQVTWTPIPWTARCSELFGVWNFARRSAAWLRKQGGAFDVVQVNGFVTWARSDVNAVHFVHSTWRKSPFHPSRSRPGLHGAYQWLFSALNARWEAKAFKQAARIVAVSERVRQELLSTGVPDAVIRVIRNGVDLDEFHPGVENRNALGLPPDVPLGLFAGDLRLMRKNLDTVLRAMTRLPHLHLAVAGRVEGSPYPEIAAGLDVQDRVHFLGFRSDMPALMRACDFLAFPSRYEACSLVLLEALASGLPVLTARSAGGAEIVSEACGHVLADPEDADGLAAIAQVWIEQPGRRLQMGRAARQIAQEHSWGAMADAYLSLYAELAQNATQACSGITPPVVSDFVSESETSGQTAYSHAAAEQTARMPGDKPTCTLPGHSKVAGS